MMDSKTILITGSSDGIGKITALTLARQGHAIIVHGRNPTKTQAVCAELKAASGNNNITYVVADLLSLKDTQRMVAEVQQRYDRLDVLINNAGAIFNKQRETTAEGLEKTTTLNLFAPFLLMQSLTNLLRKSPSARIINLSSDMHRRGGKPDFEDFQLEKSYRPERAYGLSKLYLIWITRHYAKELIANGITNITANVCHPGAVATNFGQDADKGFLINLIFKIALNFMSKPEAGASTSIYLATSPDVKNVSGEFFGNTEKVEKPDDRYYSAANEKQVWEYCKKITETYFWEPGQTIR